MTSQATLVVDTPDAWKASRSDLAAVPMPPETRTYMPVGHGDLMDLVEERLGRFSWDVDSARFALARDGQQMFAALTVVPTGSLFHDRTKDYSFAIGLRNSYDQSLAAQMVMGAMVFICSNLCFTGEESLSRKHTLNVWRDLPSMTDAALEKMVEHFGYQEQLIAKMQERELRNVEASHLMISAVRRGIFPASKLPKVIGDWDKPRHAEFAPRNAWSLLNCFTEVQKERSAALQLSGGLDLTNHFAQVLALN